MTSVQTVRRLFRPATWLAILAMLGLAIAPTISHALAASGPGNPWAEICSAASGQAVAAADAPGRQSDAGAHLGHCPLSGHLGNAPTLPSWPSTGCAAAGQAEAAPALFAAAPRPLSAWAAAQPRAPPASC